MIPLDMDREGELIGGPMARLLLLAVFPWPLFIVTFPWHELVVGKPLNSKKPKNTSAYNRLFFKTYWLEN